MSLFWIAVGIAGLLYQADAGVMEIKARPFSKVSLPCELTFVEGTDQLTFSWQREDIVEEIEVEDIYAYVQQSFEYKEPKVLFTYRNNEELQEEQSYEYEGRIELSHQEFGDGVLTLVLANVNFQDEGMYTCRAKSPHGVGERVMKLLVEDEEAPQVQFDTLENTTVARCVSTGWYKNPIVTWSDRRENDLTANATVEILEERKDGAHRVLTVLHYPVKAHEIYHCLIRDAKKTRRARTIYRKLKKGVLREYGDY
ncbi:butyrophilin subfamily 2 member A2-like [Ambystoma mexicanum]|uniref:butyrophilin subfamily 2 member A2-like n=1 Tax=Ambystoma mexicanum TaxID=8296 RepID=UPI0037E94FFB